MLCLTSLGTYLGQAGCPVWVDCVVESVYLVRAGYRVGENAFVGEDLSVQEDTFVQANRALEMYLLRMLSSGICFERLSCLARVHPLE